MRDTPIWKSQARERSQAEWVNSGVWDRVCVWLSNHHKKAWRNVWNLLCFSSFLLGQENRRRKSRSTSVNWFFLCFSSARCEAGRLEKGSRTVCTVWSSFVAEKMSFSITEAENDVVLSIFAFSSPLEREQKTLSLIFEESLFLSASSLGNLLLSRGRDR